MGLNLGISIDSFRREWEENYLSQRGNCEHHDSRFREGWIPLSTEPFSPALGRFKGETWLAREIVEALEKEWLIADYGASPLMLDRKAFTTGGSLIESYIQWYISREKI